MTYPKKWWVAITIDSISQLSQAPGPGLLRIALSPRPASVGISTTTPATG